MEMTVLASYLVACGAAAATGVMFQPGAWYRGLVRPSWTPKDWMFPVVWTTLYLLMSIAAARVSYAAATAVGAAGLGLALWSAQIALNTLWTPVFFGLHRVRAGLIIIILLWLAVAGTMVSFFRVDGWAGALMLPYLGWLSVAAALNWRILRDNPSLSDTPAAGGV